MVYEAQTVGLRARNRRFVRKKPTVCKTPFIGARFTNREHTIGESFLCGKSVARELFSCNHISCDNQLVRLAVARMA